MPSNCSPKPSRKRCLKPGPVGRNPYLNFLREYRKKCCGMSAVKTIQMGAKAWNQLRPQEKLRYVREAFYAPKKRRIMRSGVKKRMTSRSKSRHSRRRMSRSYGSRRASRPRSRSFSCRR